MSGQSTGVATEPSKGDTIKDGTEHLRKEDSTSVLETTPTKSSDDEGIVASGDSGSPL